MTKKNLDVAVLGAGITGLSTAYTLSQNNIDVTVYEKEAQVGGAIKTLNKDGWLVEEGPNTIMVRSEKIWELLDNLDLKENMEKAGKAAKKRFIVKDRRPIPLPMSPWEFITTDLFSAGAKFRVLKEPFANISTQFDESIASFITRRVGREPLDYAVNPFVSGIYAGDPQRLSIKHTFEPLWEMEQNHGSLLKGMIKRNRKKPSPKRALISFENGNQTLPKKMADSLSRDVKTGATISSVKFQENHWVIKGRTDEKRFSNKHNIVVSAFPAHKLSSIFDLPLFEELDEVPYAPLSVVALGFSGDQVEHPLDGFGMLIPEVENYQTLGVLFSSTLFANRAPNDHKLLTCFIGGARNPELATKSKEKLKEIVLDDIGELLGIKGEPVFSHHRYWKKTIPQYEVGYDRFLDVLDEIELEYPNLFVDGNFRGGVSVPDCISSGLKTAEKVQKVIKSAD